MLLGQQGGGHENGHLITRRDRHERRTQRHLGLTKSHVAANDPVHRVGPRQIGHDLIDGALLVRCFFKRKLGRKLGIVGFIRRHGNALTRGPLGLNFQQIGGGVARFFSGFLARLGPAFVAELVQRGGVGVAAGKPMHQMQ